MLGIIIKYYPGLDVVRYGDYLKGRIPIENTAPKQCIPKRLFKIGE